MLPGAIVLVDVHMHICCPLLTHWHLRDIVVISKVESPDKCCRSSSWAFFCEMASGECHRTPSMRCQRWFEQWLVSVNHFWLKVLSPCGITKHSGLPRDYFSKISSAILSDVIRSRIVHQRPLIIMSYEIRSILLYIRHYAYFADVLAHCDQIRGTY